MKSMKSAYLLCMLIFAFFAQSASAAYLNATPNPGVINPGQTTATVTINWGDAFSSTCVWYAAGTHFNGSTTFPVFCGGASGSHTYQLAQGQYYFWLSLGTQPNDQAHIIVSANPPSAPTISASPNPVPSPGNFTFPWNAPGYANVSIYASFAAGGPYACLGAGGTSGTGSGGVGSGQILYLFLTGSTSCPSTNVSTLPNPQLAVVLVRGQ